MCTVSGYRQGSVVCQCERERESVCVCGNNNFEACTTAYYCYYLRCVVVTWVL